MNRAAAERDLFSLLPSLSSGALPPELLELTTSFLAQSRSKASGLKPDEEIARSYVCANIACERLKRKLDLPDIKPRPPCPQRTYKKVFQYLSSVLGQPSHHRRQSAENTPAAVTPSKSSKPPTPAHRTLPTTTPSKTTPSNPSLRQRLSASRTKPGSARIRPSTVDDDFPAWVMSGVRALCEAFHVPAGASHVFAGVSSVARHLASVSPPPTGPGSTPSRKRSRQSLAADDADAAGLGFSERLLPPLIYVVTSYVAAQLDEAPSPREYIARRDTAFDVLARHAPFAHMQRDEFVDVVERYMREAQGGWLDMAWFANVEDAAAAAAAAAEEDTDSGTPEGGEDEEDALARRRRKRRKEGEDGVGEDGTAAAAAVDGRKGGGEMCMFAVDWLSEERTRAYHQWKEGVLAEIGRQMKSGRRRR